MTAFAALLLPLHIEASLRLTLGFAYNSMTKRQCAALQYSAPEVLLREVLPIIKSIHSGTALAVSIDSAKRKAALEKYQAAYLALLFKHGMKHKAEVSLCLHESEDFDCIFRAVKYDGDVVYKPVQLKQLPSHDVNPHVDIQIELGKLKKYSSKTLLVAYWINRNIKLDFRQLNFDKLNFEQLWFFGDSPAGIVMFHGGILADLRAGLYWAGTMKDGQVKVTPKRFKNGHA